VFQDEFQNWKNRLKRCIDIGGEDFERGKSD
jgi:hypothetical protein